MKALVLAGGFPQIDLIKKLKAQNIETILADYYESPVARDYADKFYRISTLDVDAIKQLAIDEKVDFVLTVCTDQAVLTMAKVSEELGLPCYIDYETARNVTNKAYMKKVFDKSKIPSAKFVIAGNLEDVDLSNWRFPLIVKPVDCNSSRGVFAVNYHLAAAVSGGLEQHRVHAHVRLHARRLRLGHLRAPHLPAVLRHERV